MSLASLQSAMHGAARTAGEYFKTAKEADQYVRERKAAGGRNVRKSCFVDHKRNGVPVYVWTVREESPEK